MKIKFWCLALISLIFAGDSTIKTFCVDHSELFPLKVTTFLGKVDLWIELVFNKGAAWGLFSDYPSALLSLRAVIILCLFYLLSKSVSIIKQLAYSFIIGGALSNVYETVTKGYVTDMVNFVFFNKSYGIFNFADAMICVGILFLLVPKQITEVACQN